MGTYDGDSRDNGRHKFVRTQHCQASGRAHSKNDSGKGRGCYGSKGSKSGKEGRHGGKGGKGGHGSKGVKGGHGSKGGKGSGWKGRNEQEG